VEAASEKPRRIKPEVPEDKAVFAMLTAKEQKDWKESVEYYKSKMIDHDLLFDRDMVRMKDRLEGVDDGAELRDSELDGDFVAALERAAPIYRAH
jgi:hypothetical protein